MANADKTRYQWDTLGRQSYEERFDYTLGNWVTRYDITQAYDKNGNRTGYHKNVAAGYTSSYGKAYNLSYTFDSVNALTAITDGDDANYSCAVTSDANLNITQITESDTRSGSGVLYTYFDYDALNRLGAHRTKRNTSAAPLPATWVWTKRSHQYDATGRLVKSNWKTWIDGTSEPSGDSLEHIYAGAKHVQNYDGTNYGAVWHWAGAEHEHMGPLASPNADTASQKGYNLAVGGADVAAGAGGPAGGAGGMEPQRRTVLTPTTEGDQRNLFGQGRPMAKDSSGSGSAWATGTVSQPTGARGYAVESRLMFDGTVAATDMSRATDAREKDRIGIFGTGLSYAGSYGRVTSESIGRDLNPLGRGAGEALVAGELNLSKLNPKIGYYPYLSSGNSINNYQTKIFDGCPGDPDCSPGGDSWSKYDFDFSFGICGFWAYLNLIDPNSANRISNCSFYQNCPVLSGTVCGCSIAEWFETTQCCMCRACRCVDQGNEHDAWCAAYTSTPKWCAPPEGCVCKYRSGSGGSSKPPNSKPTRTWCDRQQNMDYPTVASFCYCSECGNQCPDDVHGPDVFWFIINIISTILSLIGAITKHPLIALILAIIGCASSIFGFSAQGCLACATCCWVQKTYNWPYAPCDLIGSIYQYTFTGFDCGNLIGRIGGIVKPLGTIMRALLIPSRYPGGKWNALNIRQEKYNVMYLFQ